jgi:hypothetical protein
MDKTDANDNTGDTRNILRMIFEIASSVATNPVLRFDCVARSLFVRSFSRDINHSIGTDQTERKHNRDHDIGHTRGQEPHQRRPMELGFESE